MVNRRAVNIILQQIQDSADELESLAADEADLSLAEEMNAVVTQLVELRAELENLVDF